MARQKNERTREAILEAAIEMIADQGLNASTAAIAKQAGVASGSLFNHFESKSDLINAAYLMLKDDLNVAVLDSVPLVADTRTQLRHLWIRWTDWGASKPARRRTLAQLSVSDQVTDKSRAISFERSAVGIDIVLRAAAEGVFKQHSIDFVGSIVEAFAGATIDTMVRDPKRATIYRDATFDALWKALH